MTSEEIAQKRRRDRALHGLDLRLQKGMEFGPLDRPIVPRSESNVLYADHCSHDELLSKYADHKQIDLKRIQPVDHVLDGRPLAAVLGADAPLDYMVASHVIEHVPDLAGWLLEAGENLREGGTLVLVVPDKRFTFDVMRRESAYEEVRASFDEKRSRPGVRSVMDYFCNVVQASAWHLWEDYSGVEDLRFHHDSRFIEFAARECAAGAYFDVHCWVFTPWSFLALLGKIASDIGLAFDLGYFLTTQRHELEFYVQLRKVTRSGTDWNAVSRSEAASALWPTRPGIYGAATARFRSLRTRLARRFYPNR